MKIYRIEHKDDHKGPYQSPDDLWLTHLHAPWNGHPGPQHDCGILEKLSSTPEFNYVPNTLFGFANEQQARDWFHDDEELYNLKHEGYQLVVYEATQFFEGCRQVVFLKASSKIDRKESLNELLRLAPCLPRLAWSNTPGDPINEARAQVFLRP